MTKYPLLIITGPTATGKTQLSLGLGRFLQQNAVGLKIINFDSLCFYKELRVGTGRPTSEEQGGIPHALVGHRSISRPLNAYQFGEQAMKIIHQLHSKHQLPILVGGSGFYLRALIKGIYPAENSSQEIINHLQERYDSCGIAPFRDYLKKYDLDSFHHIHENDHYRIRRAVEYHKVHKIPFSRIRKNFEKRRPYDFSCPQNPRWHPLIWYLDLPKDLHWKMIQKRTEEMLQNGLVEEVKSLLKQGFKKEKALFSVGLKETQDYLNGTLPTSQDLKERIALSTRQLAKTQRTFFKKVYPKVDLNPLEDNRESFQDLLKIIQNWVW